jgi:hypothetical protein
MYIPCQGYMLTHKPRSTKVEFAEHAKKLAEMSPSIGEMWATVRLNCIHYGIRPYYRFEGPWVANTSHPILEVGNTADPVTPGQYAIKMASGFAGAVALLQNSAGHCSLSTASTCTQNYIKKYFQTGELPPENTLCEADEVPFGPGPGESEILDVGVLEAKERSRGIAEGMLAAGGGFLDGALRGRYNAMY